MKPKKLVSDSECGNYSKADAKKVMAKNAFLDTNCQNTFANILVKLNQNNCKYRGDGNAI